MKHNFKIGIIAFAVVIGLLFAACGGGGDSTSPSGNGDIIGIWVGTFSGYEITVTLTEERWTTSVPGLFADHGTYVRNGNTATLYSDNLRGAMVGTSELIAKDTIRVTLNSRADFPGSYDLHRVY